MAKPILSEIPVFDSRNGTKCYFKVPSGGKATSYKYVIYDSLTNAELCSKESAVGSFSVIEGYSYTIDANVKLTNRARNYYIKLAIKLVNEGSYGEFSDAMSFHCKEEPRLFFDSLNPLIENVIATSTIIFSLQYQYAFAQGETLSSYKYRLYNSDRVLIEETKTYYGNPSATYTVNSLENRKVYYIRGTGVTKCGYNLDTGLVKIKTNFYASAESATFLQCKNICEDGYISVSSHLVDITGVTTDKINFVPAGDGLAADLTHGEVVVFDLPYQIEFYRTQDYALKIAVKPVHHKNLVELILDQDGFIYKAIISTNIRAFTDGKDRGEKFYATMKIIRDDGGFAAADICFLNSNYLDYSADMGYVMIYLQHKNNFYEIKVEEVAST